MRKAKMLLVLLLIAVIGFAVVVMRFGGDLRTRSALQKDAPLPTATQEKNSELSAGQAPALNRTDPQRPTFDVVRVEKDGSVVMAGQAEAGATVIVRSGDKEIGRAIADTNGEWVLEQGERLDRAEHGIELSAQSPDGHRTLYSKQRLALSLSEAKKNGPLVALTEEGKPTRILQMPAPELLSELAEATSEQIVGTNSLNQPETSGNPALQPKAEQQQKPAPAVGFASIDYEDADQKSMVFINGIGTPGSRVGVYINNKFIGFAVADASGSWSFSDNRQLDAGKHALRADVLDKETNKVLARAEVNFDREPTSASKTAVFDQGSKLVSLSAASDVQASSSIDAQPKVVVVKRGDTLWQIAERYYGDGARYTQIFKNNLSQIRNPHRIYPNQEFLLPDGSSSLNR